MDEGRSSGRLQHWWVGPSAVFLIALVVRLLFALHVDGLQLTVQELEHDNQSYFELAARASDGDLMSWTYRGPGPDAGEVVPTAFRPPLWPVVQAVPYVLTEPSPTVGRLWNITLSAAACALMVVLGRRLHSNRVGWMAGIGAAFWPQFVEAARQLMSETLLVLLVVLLLLALDAHLTRAHRGAPAAIGVLFGLIGLVRGNGLGVAVAVGCWLLWIGRRRLRPTLRDLTTMAACTLLVVGPYVAYQSSRLDTFVPVSTQGGVVLAGDFNDRVADRSYPRWGWWDIEPTLAVLETVDNEVEWDRQSREVGADWIRDHPATAAKVLGLRALRYGDAYWEIDGRVATGVTGTSRTLSILSPVAWWLLATLSVLALVRLRRAGEGLLRWAPIGVLFLTFAVFGIALGGPSRYRVPAEPGLILLASTLGADWLDRWIRDGARQDRTHVEPNMAAA